MDFESGPFNMYTLVPFYYIATPVDELDRKAEYQKGGKRKQHRITGRRESRSVWEQADVREDGNDEFTDSTRFIGCENRMCHWVAWAAIKWNESLISPSGKDATRGIPYSPKLMAASLCLMRKQLISFFAFSLYKNYSSEIIPAVTCLLKYFMRIINSDYIKYS